MRAAVYYGPMRLEVTEVPTPDPGVGQVKVKVGFNGICGTDLHEFYSGPIFVPTEPHPLTGRQLPLTLGHEFSGVITDVGDEVIGYAEGDRVAIEPIYSCGKCGPCEAELYNLCQHIGMHGLTADGGMAEYAVVPSHMLHRLPENVSLELGALVEPMSVAYHAAGLGGVNAGDTVLVLGAGPIGIGIWFALRAKGIQDIFVVEPSITRRTAIEALGARTLTSATVDIPEFVAYQTGGSGADVVFDAAGTQPAIESALACVGARGTVVSVAMYERPLTTPLLNLVMTEARIQGSFCYTGADFDAVIDLMARGAYDTTGWVTAIALGDVVEHGFDALRAGTRMKVLIDPSI
jgi:(R,R)-butanediol dehydrogenase / meso-butanediol dehydrogenase / diacetyl reductase